MESSSIIVNEAKKEAAISVFWRRLRKNKLAVVGLFIIILLVLVATFAPFIAPYDFAEQDLMNTFAPPSREHLLGTDDLGRDELSRLIYGTRQSLQIGVFSVAIGVTIGTILGTLAGFYGGRADMLLMRFLDVYQSIPGLLLSIALATSLGPGLENAIIAIGVGTMSVYARIIRASLLRVRSMEYIEAARAINANDFRIVMKHALPNAIAPLLITVTMSIGQSILSASMLSFIGLGAQPPTAEWGAMLTAGKDFMRTHGSLITYPGIAMLITVLSFNLLGDGLRDALDPRLKN
jgi:peptide/nickel transport system permease protein